MIPSLSVSLKCHIRILHCQYEGSLGHCRIHALLYSPCFDFVPDVGKSILSFAAFDVASLG